MTKLHMTRTHIELFTAPLLVLAGAGVEVDATTTIVLHFRHPVVLKYQSVQLAPGLHGQVTSDDGMQVTVNAHNMLCWLLPA